MAQFRFREFKDFAIKGNAIDMAVGIIIGIAFGKIVNSLVNDIIMPPIGMLIGGVDFSDLYIILKKATETEEVVAIYYGAFINTLIDFTIIALSIFLVIKVVSILQRKKEKTQNTKKCFECQMEIPIKAKRCGHCTVKLP